MEFRVLDGVKVQRPSFDVEDLAAESGPLKGDFDLDLVHLSGVDQAAVSGEGTLSHSLVESVKLAGARLAPLTLSDVTVRNVDLSNAVLSDTTARRAEFTKCRAIGLNLGLVHAADLYVEATQFDYASVRFGKVKNSAVFVGCTFREAVLSGDLSNVVFADCDFAGAEFEAIRAGACDLRGSRLAGARGLLTLRGALITTEQALSVATTLAVESGLSIVD
ncbi:pentapeptide repeat-containing protein [Amycolatopsis sp. cg5]|uniref:pentapeptide repeat-containing protein n=1 Tax=Amycolatopsis sp. cg5 TaxID=3238802 RepID=UPI00352526E3